MAYAHAVIEVPRDANDPSKGVDRYERGHEVPDDIPGYDELVDAGSVSDEEYDASKEPKLVPEYVEIDGVRYIRTGDGAKQGEESNAGE